MDLHVLEKGSRTILEGEPDRRLLGSAEDVAEIIGACFGNKAPSVLLYAENLTEHFFDLSSGEAGIILQKFRNYHIRLAVVVREGTVSQSPMFREMMKEEGKGDDFRIFSDRASAEAWLLGDA